MSFLLRSALKDLRRQAADPVAALIWFGIPLAIAAMIVLAFGGKEAKAPVAELLIADLDSTVTSGLLIQSLSRVPVIHVQAVGPEEGRRLIEKGKGSAFLVIPKGFDAAVLDRTPMTLDLVRNPSQRILPGIIEESVSVLVDAIFYLQEAVGDRLNELRAAANPGGGFDATAIAAFSVSINDIVEKSRGTLLPPVLKFVVDAPPEKKDEDPGFGVLFFPGILFMSLLFMGQGLAGDLWVEKNNGTLRRALAAPGGAVPLLGGKILCGMIVAAAVSFGAMILGRFLFGIPAGRLALGLVWAAFSGGVLLSLMIVIQVYAGTQRAAGLLTSLILFPLLMVGGSFFPFEAMPEAMARIGRLTPNGWALEELKAILLGRADLAGLIPPLLGLLAAGGLAFLVSARRLPRFTTGA